MIFEEDGVPPSLWERAKGLNQSATTLKEEIETLQSRCGHDWKPVRWKDPNYCQRLDGQGRGQVNVIKHFHCALCNSIKFIQGQPWVTCRLCGGEMKFLEHTQFGMDRASVHKCSSCGHEHDTL